MKRRCIPKVALHCRNISTDLGSTTVLHAYSVFCKQKMHRKLKNDVHRFHITDNDERSKEDIYRILALLTLNPSSSPQSKGGSIHRCPQECSAGLNYSCIYVRFRSTFNVWNATGLGTARRVCTRISFPMHIFGSAHPLC